MHESIGKEARKIAGEYDIRTTRLKTILLGESEEIAGRARVIGGQASRQAAMRLESEFPGCEDRIRRLATQGKTSWPLFAVSFPLEELRPLVRDYRSSTRQALSRLSPEERAGLFGTRPFHNSVQSALFRTFTNIDLDLSPLQLKSRERTREHVRQVDVESIAGLDLAQPLRWGNWSNADRYAYAWLSTYAAAEAFSAFNSQVGKSVNLSTLDLNFALRFDSKNVHSANGDPPGRNLNRYRGLVTVEW